MTSYCVVGGGIAGLTAAYRLRRALGDDATITLFEPADLGGILQTRELAGHPVDVGAEAFVARRPEVPALLAELGLADRRVETTGARPLIYSEGRLHPLPTGTVNGIPAAPEPLAGLVDDATLATMRDEPARPMRWARGADPAVGEVVADRFGDQVVARSVDPMLSGVYAGSARTIGIRAAAPGVAAALDAGAANLTAAVAQALPPATGAPVFNAVAGGYRVLVAELVRRAAADLQRAAVTDLVSDGGRWRLRAGDRWWSADGVVLAVPAPVLPVLLADAAPAVAAAAARIRAASSVVLAMALPPDTALPQQSGVLVATGEPLHAKAITLTSRKWGRGGDVELLRMSFGRLGDQVARAVSDETLRGWALEDLRTVFGLSVEPIAVATARWLDAMPQYGPGHAGLVAELRGGLPPGLVLAGNFLDGIGVPACVASGTAAAAALRTVSGTMEP
ncbi:protoporphyrinogen oxidase [Mycobacterium sp. MYCO198283]|uniref:protoporphyrinogen oxidase n=1 Tax=Mycobacterium sp. MYCO198283 TaxID=2883505 RepID=UPI001E50F3DE|nr:protoporphyrinogen oxidase [Mycobacterium sp. MYCO198283]MCG5433915.1 protoporphyrinogen oxidase [Mycobacterium sp. MYCO198283]